MELTKAIELNTESERSLRDHKFIDHANAIKIGNEAIERIRECRLADHTIKEDLLPGETED